MLKPPAVTAVFRAVMRAPYGAKTSAYLVRVEALEWISANVLTAAPDESIQIRTRSGDLLWADAGVLRRVFRFKVAERGA
jgi:hypothetical protein